MQLRVFEQELSVCKVRELPAGALEAELCFVGKTDEELSLVCEPTFVPEDALECDDGWRAFRIEGVLDFSMVGVLAEISAALAQVRVSLFAVSTYNTDYILVKSQNLERALSALESAGYEIVRN